MLLTKNSKVNFQYLSEIPGAFLPFKNDSYRIGSYGCLLSHYKIIEKAYREKHSRILILEDDTGFKNDLKILENAHQQLVDKNLSFGILYLSGNHKKKTDRISENIVKVNKTYTTNSYIIDNSVYEFILKGLIKWTAEIDVFYSNVLQQEFNCYCTSPHITYQKSGKSDILNYTKEFI